MTIRSHGRRHRSPLWAKLTLALGLVLVVVTGSAYTAMRVVSHEINVSVPGVDLLNPPDTGTKPHKDVKGAKNLLLVSLDTRPSWSKSHEPSRSDSIIIMHIPAGHSTAYMLSIPGTR